IEAIWDHRVDDVDPLVARAFHESLRLLRRAEGLYTLLGGDGADQEAFEWQVSRLAALEPALRDYLAEAGPLLTIQVPGASLAQQKDLLMALADLRVEAGPVVLPLVHDPRYPHMELALDVLLWSRHASTGATLRELALKMVP